MDYVTLDRSVRNRLSRLEACKGHDNFLREAAYQSRQIEQEFASYHKLNPNNGKLAAELKIETDKRLYELLCLLIGTEMSRLNTHIQVAKQEQIKQD